MEVPTTFFFYGTLVIQHNYGKWRTKVDDLPHLPIKNCDFFHTYVRLPGGITNFTITIFLGACYVYHWQICNFSDKASGQVDRPSGTDMYVVHMKYTYTCI